jgi:tetratricopeptide (TPR) repeat protein
VTNLGTPSTLLDTARGYAQARDWRGLAEWGASVGDLASAPPEVAYLYADARRRTGDVAAATRVLAALEPAVRRGGDTHLLLRTINLAGIAAFESGGVADAEERFLDLLEVSSNAGDDDFAARASNGLGAVANLRGDRARAIVEYVRAIAGYRRLGQVRGLAQTYHNLGISYRDLGFDADADAQFGRAIELGQESESEDVVGMAETERAMLRVRGGDPELAAEMARRAQERFVRMGAPVEAGEAVRVLAAAARATGDDDAALRHLDAALATAREHQDPLLLAEVQRDRGLLRRDHGDAAAAREALGESAQAYASLGAAAEAAAVRAVAAEL